MSNEALSQVEFTGVTQSRSVFIRDFAFRKNVSIFPTFRSGVQFTVHKY